MENRTATFVIFSKVSDPAVGGTYMTLLNTICNLGGNWPSTLVLWLVDPLTSKECQGGTVFNDCSTSELRDACNVGGGSCSVLVDGFYVESIICTVFGFLWLLWGRRTAEKLESLPESSWRVVGHRRQD